MKTDNAAVTVVSPEQGKISTKQISVKMDDIPETGLENQVVNLYPEFSYQKMIGFGGAMTESSAYVLSCLSPADRQEALRLYFGNDGCGYTLLRTHIDSCDFALHVYQAEPDSDPDLHAFSIERDRKYIIPALRDAMAFAPGRFSIMLAPWSPPAEWKTPPLFLKNIHSENDLRKLLPPELQAEAIRKQNPVLQSLYESFCESVEKGTGMRKCGGRLKPAYYAPWAKYLVKYVRAYLDEGIPVRWLSIQNESMAATPWDSCQWTPSQEKEFLQDYLYPEMCRAGLEHDVGIVFWDHNKENLLDFSAEMIDEKTRSMVSGAAFHFYSGDHFDALRMLHERYPQLDLMATESCFPMSASGSHEEQMEGVKYAHDIIGNLNQGMDAWFDWNLYLDEHGGPNHVGNYCSAPVMLDGKGGFMPRSSYHYIRQISHNIQPGAVRIGTTSYSSDLDVTAVCNPDRTISAVILNHADQEKKIHLRLHGRYCQVDVPGWGMAVIRIDNGESSREESQK